MNKIMNAKDCWGFTIIGIGIALYLVQTVVAAIEPNLGETIAEAYTPAFLIGLGCLSFFISSAPYWAVASAIIELLLFTSAIQRKHPSSLPNWIRRGKTIAAPNYRWLSQYVALSQIPAHGTARRSSRIIAIALLSLVLTPYALAYQPGKDGVGTVTTANTVINTYTTLTTAAAQNAAIIAVASATGISAGDVLLLYNTQGATINTPNSNLYGAISSLGNAGRFEMVNVISVASATITIQSGGSTNTCGGGLRNNYDSGAQVIRVPQYTSLTISGTGSIVAQAWNGTTGGIVAALVQTTASIGGGGISVVGQGLRGGGLINNTSAFGTDWTYYVNDFPSLAAVEERLLAFQTHYKQLPNPLSGNSLDAILPRFSIRSAPQSTHYSAWLHDHA